jgi:hypothetical protein
MCVKIFYTLRCNQLNISQRIGQPYKNGMCTNSSFCQRLKWCIYVQNNPNPWPNFILDNQWISKTWQCFETFKLKKPIPHTSFVIIIILNPKLDLVVHKSILWSLKKKSNLGYARLFIFPRFLRCRFELSSKIMSNSIYTLHIREC